GPVVGHAPAGVEHDPIPVAALAPVLGAAIEIELLGLLGVLLHALSTLIEDPQRRACHAGVVGALAPDGVELRGVPLVLGLAGAPLVADARIDADHRLRTAQAAGLLVE